MRKYIALLLSIILIVNLTACGENQTKKETNDETIEVTAEEQTNEEIPTTGEVSESDKSFILSREIFVFRDPMPSLYSDTVDLTNSNAYKENWVLSDVLNDANFEHIEWQYDSIDGNAGSGKLISFFGNSKLNNTNVSLDFFWQSGSKIPFLFSITVIGDSNPIHIDVTDFNTDNKALSDEEAVGLFIITDAAIASTLLTIYSMDFILEDNSTYNSEHNDLYLDTDHIGEYIADVIDVAYEIDSFGDTYEKYGALNENVTYYKEGDYLKKIVMTEGAYSDYGYSDMCRAECYFNNNKLILVRVYDGLLVDTFYFDDDLCVGYWSSDGEKNEYKGHVSAFNISELAPYGYYCEYAIYESMLAGAISEEEYVDKLSYWEFE